jgi:uncharacterized zinc-type alcohol dehydrogenase-like protein
MSQAIGWAATSVTVPLSRFEFSRRDPRPDDVVIDIDFCGVCHSDIHTARSEWPWTTYPVVPGHEIVGRVRSAGAAVTRFQPGDLVGVSVAVDSCGKCAECRAGFEASCAEGCTYTYGSEQDGQRTQGGYSSFIVVREDFVLRMPSVLDPAAAAPLLCAGATMWDPLKRYVKGPGAKVGIAGLGGLGTIGVKLAVALGSEVTVFTTSPAKQHVARELGASEVVDVRDPEDLERVNRSLDLIISTIPRTHDVSPYLLALRLYGSYVIVGAIEPMVEPYDADVLIGRRASISGAGVGSNRDTQELLDFCAARGIASDVDVIPIDRINDVYDRIVTEQPATRFVIDMGTLR